MASDADQIMIQRSPSCPASEIVESGGIFFHEPDDC